MSAKKSVAILLAVLLLLLSANVLAAPSTSRYKAILIFRSSLSISGSGTAYCDASLWPSSTAYSASLTATLKKSADGITWTYVASWSASGSHTSSANISKTVSVSPGYQYKLFTTGRVYGADGTLLETAYKNSSMVSY